MDNKKPYIIFVAASIGALMFFIVHSTQQSSFLLASTQPITMAGIATTTVPVAQAYPVAQGFADEAQAMADDMVLEEEVALVTPPSSSSWSPMMVLGLIPAVVAASVAFFHRKTSSAPSPIMVDLEAGTLSGVQIGQSSIFAPSGRPSLALNAKKDIHPEMYEAPVFCGGEQVMTTIGTKKEYVTDIWSGNHPFYQKGAVAASTTGRIDRFKNKFAKYGGLGAVGEVPVSTGPAVLLKLEPKSKKKAGKK